MGRANWSGTREGAPSGTSFNKMYRKSTPEAKMGVPVEPPTTLVVWLSRQDLLQTSRQLWNLRPRLATIPSKVYQSCATIIRTSFGPVKLWQPLEVLHPLLGEVKIFYNNILSIEGNIFEACTMLCLLSETLCWASFRMLTLSSRDRLPCKLPMNNYPGDSCSGSNRGCGGPGWLDLLGYWKIHKTQGQQLLAHCTILIRVRIESMLRQLDVIAASSTK